MEVKDKFKSKISMKLTGYIVEAFNDNHGCLSEFECYSTDVKKAVDYFKKNSFELDGVYSTIWQKAKGFRIYPMYEGNSDTSQEIKVTKSEMSDF